MTAVVVVAALVGLVWGGIFLLRGSPIVGCLAVLLSVCCFGYEFLHFEPSLTIDRVLLAALVAGFVVRRALGRTDPKPFRGIPQTCDLGGMDIRSRAGA